MRSFISLASFSDEFEKIAFNWKAAKDAAKVDIGPALGSVIGSYLAAGHGINPLAGAAAGYGLGSIHEIYHGIKNRGHHKHSSVKLGGFNTPFGISAGAAAADAVRRGQMGGGAMAPRAMPGAVAPAAPVRHTSSAAYGNAAQFHPAANVQAPQQGMAQPNTAFGAHNGPLELATPQPAPRVQRVAPQGQPAPRPVPPRPQMPARRV